MKAGEEPDGFIDQLDEKRSLMNKTIDNARRVDEDLFIKHVLTKLPKAKKDRALGLYQVERSRIESEMKRRETSNEPYNMVDLRVDLERLHLQLYGQDDSSDSSDSSAGDESTDSDSSDEDVLTKKKSHKGKKKSKKKGEVGLPVFGKQQKRKCPKCGKFHGGKCFGANYKKPFKSGGGYNKSYTGNSNNKHKDMTCFNCGKKGHIAADCYSKKTNAKTGERGEIAFIGIDTEGEICLPCLDVGDHYDNFAVDALCIDSVDEKDRKMPATISDGELSDDFFDCFEIDDSELSHAEIMSDEVVDDYREQGGEDIKWDEVSIPGSIQGIIPREDESIASEDSMGMAWQLAMIQEMENLEQTANSKETGKSIYEEDHYEDKAFSSWWSSS